MRSILNQGGGRRGRPQPQSALKTTTIREFDGGWNVVDTDLNLSSRFSKVERNVSRGLDGSKNVRWGTQQLAHLADQETIVNCYYYQEQIISVHEDGRVTKTDARGNYEVIFDNYIASFLPGSPKAWGQTSFVSFDTFNGYLILCNGTNKPLIIYPNMVVEYLNDPSNNSNANTPIARYIAAADRYVVLAGDPFDPYSIFVSATDTWGVYVGDPEPNDAVNLNMANFVSRGDPTIKALHFFRGSLIVSFEEETAIVTLGIFDGNGNHTPAVTDIVQQHGAVSHRSVQTLENDVFYVNAYGVPNLTRALYTEQIRPSQSSILIAPDLQRRIQQLSIATLEDRVFSVYNHRDGEYMVFIPNENIGAYNETVGYIYSYIPSLKVKAWAEFRGWNWRSGCISALGNVFFTRDNRIFLYGNESYPIHADHEYYEEEFSDGTVFTDGRGFEYTLNLDLETGGISIPFDWELPWADFEQRTLLKNIKHIQTDTQGTGAFTLDLFVDNFYIQQDWTGDRYTDGTLHQDGTGFANIEYPTLGAARAMEFVGGDAPQYGFQLYGSSRYGGGRISSDERLYHVELRGKLFKLRFHGRTRNRLQFVSIGINWQMGSIRR